MFQVSSIPLYNVPPPMLFPQTGLISLQNPPMPASEPSQLTPFLSLRPMFLRRTTSSVSRCQLYSIHTAPIPYAVRSYSKYWTVFVFPICPTTPAFATPKTDPMSCYPIHALPFTITNPYPSQPQDRPEIPLKEGESMHSASNTRHSHMRRF